MKNVKGFTIIELMVTLVILGAGVGALTYLQSRLATMTQFASVQYDAVALANSKLDSWRAQSYDNISVVTSQSDTTTIGNTAFTRTWNVSESISPTYKVMDVTVSWTDEDGVSQSIKLASAIAKTSQSDAEV